MDWIPVIVAAIGGGVVVKILDIVWLQRVLENRDHKAWLREKRLSAYTRLAEELLTVGTGDRGNWDMLKVRGECATALLIATDDSLYVDVTNFLSLISQLIDVSRQSLESQGSPDHAKHVKRGTEIAMKITIKCQPLIEKLRSEIVGE